MTPNPKAVHASVAAALLVLIAVAGAVPNGKNTPPIAAPKTPVSLGEKALTDPNIQEVIKTIATGDYLTANPCRTVTYAVDPHGMPPKWNKAIGQAVALVQQLSGVKFKRAPFESLNEADRFFPHRGSVRPTTAVGVKPAPLLMGFVTPKTSPALVRLIKEQGKVYGYFSPEYGRLPSGKQYIASGVIGLYAKKMSPLRSGQPGPYGELLDEIAYDKAVELVMHELGHFLGLGHLEDTSRDSIMRPAQGYAGALTYFDIRLFAAAGALSCV